MHFQTFLEESNKISSYQQLQQQINEQKEQKVKSDIQSLEHIWVQWLSQQQMSQKQNEDLQKKNEQIDVECSQETNAVEKSAQLKNFFEILKSRIINEKLYSTMTQTQMTQFFEEATTQIQNKIKLYEDIQKLKLLQNYPTNTKRTYSKSANMILKKWLIENYSNPYPKPHQVEQLVYSALIQDFHDRQNKKFITQNKQTGLIYYRVNFYNLHEIVFFFFFIQIQIKIWCY